MQLNNASLPTKSLRGYTRFLTNTDGNSFSDNDLTALLNKWYHSFVQEAIQGQDDIDFNLTTETINLTANTQTYSVTGKVLRVKRMEVTYDGTNWYKVNVFDVNQTSNATDTTSIANNFEKTNPYAEVYVQDEVVKISLYPIPDTTVANGLKVWKVVEITELSTDTDEPSLYESSHKGLCYGAAMDYFLKYGDPKWQNMKALMDETIIMMKDHYRSRMEDKEIILSSSNNDYGYGL